MFAEMSSWSTRMRFWLPVRVASAGLFLPSGKTWEFWARLNSALFSSAGRSLATAIIIPNTVETPARTSRPTTISVTRSFLTFGLALGGAPLGPDAPGAGTCEGIAVVGGFPM